MGATTTTLICEDYSFRIADSSSVNSISETPTYLVLYCQAMAKRALV